MYKQFRLLVSIAKSVINILFPNRCPICNKINSDGNFGFCSICWNKLELIQKPSCDICNNPFDVDVEDGCICGSCLSKLPSYKKARSVFKYNDFIKKIIFDFKYRDSINYAEFFADLMINAADDILNDVEIVVPVPLHKSRLKKRKYNQAVLLINYIVKKTNKIAVNDLLIRKINTKPQVNLAGKERVKNVKNAFDINHKYAKENFNYIKNKSILIVDDVMTTGSTIENCAKVLLKNGAKDVFVLTFARTIGEKRIL